MRIETTLIRPGGTFAEVGGVTYHFAPTATDPRHIAEVASPKAIQRFLQIEGYQVPEDVDETLVPPIKGPDTPAAQPVQPLVLDVAGFLGAPVSRVTNILDGADDTGEGEGEHPDETPPVDVGARPMPEPAVLPEYDTMETDALKVIFEQKYGRAAHPRAGRNKLIEALINHDLAHQPATN